MRKILISFILLSLATVVSYSQEETENIRLFYLGGQSNMDGYGTNSELPDSLKGTLDNVWIFHGNPVRGQAEGGGTGIWEQMRPGHGRGFSSDGKRNKLSERFGPELSFAYRMSKLYPGEKIAIIKYSVGGTSIDSSNIKSGNWDPDFTGINGINQYDNFLTTLRNAYAAEDIDGNGIRDNLIPCGIVWMQGESDAHNEEVALMYYDNLKRLMDLIRAALHTDDLPVVIGKISDSGKKKTGKVWKYGELVQYAQEKYANNDKHASIIRSTQNYSYSDPYHYNSKGFIDLGEQFAKSVIILSLSK